MAQVKKSKKASGSASSVRKEAKKALAVAEESVKLARKAVTRSSAKLRREAQALTKETKKLADKHDKAARQLDAASTIARAQTTAMEKPSPSVVAASTPHLASSPTLAELRRQARERKIVGYSRLNKADLVAKLDSARS